MYAVRPARYTLDELIAQSREVLARATPTSVEPAPFVWSSCEGRWINNPEFATFKHGKFQK